LPLGAKAIFRHAAHGAGVGAAERCRFEFGAEEPG
jgi:hypothetical protein